MIVATVDPCLSMQMRRSVLCACCAVLCSVALCKCCFNPRQRSRVENAHCAIDNVWLADHTVVPTAEPIGEHVVGPQPQRRPVPKHLLVETYRGQGATHRQLELALFFWCLYGTNILYYSPPTVYSVVWLFPIYLMCSVVILSHEGIPRCTAALILEIREIQEVVEIY